MTNPSQKITTHDFLRYLKQFLEKFDASKTDPATLKSLNILGRIAGDLANHCEPLSDAFASKVNLAKDKDVNDNEVNANVLYVLLSDSIYLNFFETYPILLQSITKEALNYCFKTDKGHTVSPLLNLFREDKNGLAFLFKFKDILFPLIDVKQFDQVKMLEGRVESCYDFIGHLAEYKEGLQWLIENHFELARMKPNVIFKLLNSNYYKLFHGESLTTITAREGALAQPNLNVTPAVVMPQITYKQFKTDLKTYRPDLIDGLNILLFNPKDPEKSQTYINKELLEIYNEITDYSDEKEPLDHLPLEQALSKCYSADGNGTIESILIKCSNLGGLLFLAAYPHYFNYLTHENLNFYSMVVWPDDRNKILIESPLSRILMLRNVGIQFLIDHDMVKFLDISLLDTPGFYREGQRKEPDDQYIQKMILDLMKFPETMQWLVLHKNHPKLKSHPFFISTLLSTEQFHSEITDFALDTKTISECLLPKHIKDECKLSLTGSTLSFHCANLEKKYPNIVKSLLASFNQKKLNTKNSNKENKSLLIYKAGVIEGKAHEVYRFIEMVNAKVEELKALAQFDSIEETPKAKQASKKKGKKPLTKNKVQQPALIPAPTPTPKPTAKKNKNANKNKKKKEKKEIYPLTAEAQGAYQYLEEKFSNVEFHLVGSQVAEAYLRGKKLPSINPNDVDFVINAQIGQQLIDDQFKHSQRNGHDLYTKDVDGVHIEIKILPPDTNIDAYLLERDLSIAAMRANKAGEIFDPSGRGLIDLRKRQLRMINEATSYFKHSPTTMIRIAKLKMLDFNLEAGLSEKIAAWERDISKTAWLDDHIGKRMKAFYAAARKTEDWKLLRKQERDYTQILSDFRLLEKVYDDEVMFDPTKPIEDLRIQLKGKLGIRNKLDFKDDETFAEIKLQQKMQQKAQTLTPFFAQQELSVPEQIVSPTQYTEYDAYLPYWLVWSSPPPPPPIMHMRTVEEIESTLIPLQAGKK